MRLIYKSKAFPITIKEYSASSFIYEKWGISDEYTEVTIGHEYRIVVTSLDDIKDQNDLCMLTIQTSSFVERLTMLLKYAVGISLNSPHNQLTYRCVRWLDMRECLRGGIPILTR